MTETRDSDVASRELREFAEHAALHVTWDNDGKIIRHLRSLRRTDDGDA